jgi:hypothetical protein
LPEAEPKDFFGPGVGVGLICSLFHYLIDRASLLSYLRYISIFKFNEKTDFLRAPTAIEKSKTKKDNLSYEEL